MSRGSDDFGSLFVTFLILGLILAIASMVTVFAFLAIPAYIGYRLWKDNPKRLERLAREETKILYDHALAGSVRLSESEIDVALCRH